MHHRDASASFPGSTIGNLDPAAAHASCCRHGTTLGAGARFLVGVDLRKDQSVLFPAYDDAQGVTAAFNLNMLSAPEPRAWSDFDLAAFAHRAIWNERKVASRCTSSAAGPNSAVSVGGTSDRRSATGETIHTENSYKHTVADLTAMADAAGWRSERVWTDGDDLFSIHLLAAK